MGSGVNTASNTELRSMLQSAMGQLNSLGFSSSSLTSAAGSGNDLSRSLWTIAGEAEAAIDGNDEQKAQATINILDGLLKMVLGGNHQAEANKEVKENSDKINKNDTEETKKANELKAKIESFGTNIQANTSNINDALDRLDALGNESKDVEDLRQQILAQLQIIEAKKEELKDPEKREAALKEISTAAETIDALVELIGQTILYMQETVEEQNAIVEQNVNETTESITKSAEEISTGAADIQKYIQNNATEGSKATRIATQGGTDVATGDAEVAAGEATNSNMFSALFSGGQGVKLILDGNQRISGGQTRISGGAQNLSAVMQGIGRMGQDISSLSELTDGLGKVGNGVLDLVGQYQTKTDAFIKSIGTFDIKALTSANDLLQAEVITLTAPSVPGFKNKQVNSTNTKTSDSQTNQSGEENKSDAVANMKAVVEKAKFGV